MLRRTAACVLVLCLLLTGTAAVPSSAAPGGGEGESRGGGISESGGGQAWPGDAVPGSFYYQPLMWASSCGIVRESDGMLFEPDSPCTRAQAVVWLWRQAGEPAPRSSGSPYLDVEEDDPRLPALLWAKEQGIALGNDRGCFMPERTIIRADAVTLLWRACGSPHVKLDGGFLDIADGIYYMDSAAWAAVYGIVEGTGDRHFSPLSLCTRGMFVTMLWRFVPDGPLFELPVSGATGVVSVSLNLRTEPSAESPSLGVLAPGTIFRIEEESGDWWRITTHAAAAGWVQHRYCMISLPDVLPSIVYDDTNSYSSLYRTSGRAIPGITGQKLYSCSFWNGRFGREEYVMPMLYAAAKMVAAAQRNARREGNSLCIYETFRPYATQMAVVSAMSALMEADPAVRAGVSTKPWTLDNFIAVSRSKHQKGIALDVSLVKITEMETMVTGEYRYRKVTAYEPYTMPTPMHELSIRAVSATRPKGTVLAPTMNAPAVTLRGYFTAAGFSPLASEWWHFNAESALPAEAPCRGEFFIGGCMSTPPS